MSYREAQDEGPNPWRWRPKSMKKGPSPRRKVQAHFRTICLCRYVNLRSQYLPIAPLDPAVILIHAACVCYIFCIKIWESSNRSNVHYSVLSGNCSVLSAFYFFPLLLFSMLHSPLYSFLFFLPTILVFDFFYLNKWFIAIWLHFHHSTYHFFSTTHIPLLFLFFLYFFHCLLLPLHSPINSSLILLTNTHPNGEGQTLLFLFSISHHIFHSLVFRVFKSSRRRGAVYTITTSHQPSSPPSSSPWESRLLSYSREDLRVCDLRVLPTFHMVYFNLFFNYSFWVPLCCLFILCIS